MKKLTLFLIVILPLTAWTQRQRDTIPVLLLVSDTSRSASGEIIWRKGYSVREKHNTIELAVDPKNVPEDFKEDFFQHLLYLDESKMPLQQRFVVWNAKPVGELKPFFTRQR
jgi:hypothetical protein